MNSPSCCYVSIITAFYNAGNTIQETAKSVFGQTLPFFEWIIVNDGTTKQDDLVILEELAQQDKRVKIVHKKNGGIASARNLGMTYATGKYVVPLDADDLLHPTFLEMLFWALESKTEAAWGCTYYKAFGQHDYEWKIPFFDSRIEKQRNILPVTAMIRKEVLQAIGGYEEEEKKCFEDWLLWLRLLRFGYRPLIVPYFGFFYRTSDSGVMSEIYQDCEKKKLAMKLVLEEAALVSDGISAFRYPLLRRSIPRRLDGKQEKLIKEFRTLEAQPNSKERRYLLLSSNLELGGVNSFHYDFFRAAIKQGCKFFMLLTNEGEEEWRECFESLGIEVINLTQFLPAEEWVAFLLYYIESRQIQLIFCDNSYFGYQVLPLLRMKYPDMPFVDFVHMEDWRCRGGGYLRMSCAMSDFLEMTFVSAQYLRTIMVREYKRLEEQVKISYIGADVTVYKMDHVKNANGKKIVLLPCRLTEQKRPLFMVDIANEVSKLLRDVEFWIIGEGPEEESMKQKVKELCLQEKIRFFGKQTDMYSFYQQAHITLICSLQEGLALTTYESFSMGIPVVSSDVGGQSEAVNDSVGKLIKYQKNVKEVDAFAKAIVEILSNDTLHEKLGKQARKAAEEKFNRSSNLQQLVNEIVFLSAGKGLEKRRQKALMLQKFPALVEDYVRSYFEYSHELAVVPQVSNEKLENKIISKWGNMLRCFCGKQVIVFGTGSTAENLIYYFVTKIQEQYRWNIVYLVDNNPEKWKKELMGYTIFEPERILLEDKAKTVVVIASQYYKEIGVQLETMGLVREMNFWNGYPIDFELENDFFNIK